MNNDHDRNSDMLCLCLPFHNTVETANSTVLEIAALTNAKTAHNALEETPTLEKSLKAWALDLECQTAAQTVGHPASLYLYDQRTALVRHNRG